MLPSSGIFGSALKARGDLWIAREPSHVGWDRIREAHGPKSHLLAGRIGFDEFDLHAGQDFVSRTAREALGRAPSLDRGH
jgi:hypothetical protein